MVNRVRVGVGVKVQFSNLKDGYKSLLQINNDFLLWCQGNLLPACINMLKLGRETGNLFGVALSMCGSNVFQVSHLGKPT